MSQYNVKTFAARVIATLDDYDATTEAGNPKPVLLTASYAQQNPAEPADALPTEEFYVEAAACLNSHGLVAFPTSMFDVTDICVMNSVLFQQVRNDAAVDPEASIVLEDADLHVLHCVERAINALHKDNGHVSTHS